ncbi:hypothetical protein ABPG72_016352 [Tetrahymena utriculariae]
MKYQQIKQNSFLELIKSYYTEEIHRLVHQFPRDNPVFSILIIVKYSVFQFLAISNYFQKITDKDFNFSFLKQYGIVGYLQNNQFVNTLVYILIFFNGILLTYIIFTLLRFVSQKQRFIDLSQMTFNPDCYYKIEENICEKQNFADKYFSLLITIYQNMIYFPSLFLSLNNLSNNISSYFLLSATLILNLIISDVDYNYEIKIKDYLARPFSKIYFAFNYVIEICIIAAIVFAPQGQSTLQSCYFIISGLSSNFLSKFYERFSQQLNNFAHISLFGISIFLQISISFRIPNKLLSYFIIIYIPISFKMASQISEFDYQNLLSNLQQLSEESQFSLVRIDQIMRLNVFDNIEYQKENEKRYLRLLNLIVNSKQSKFSYLSNFKKDSGYFDQQIKQNEQTLEFDDLSDESYRKYFLKFLQFTQSSKLSLKNQQIFNSIHQIFLKKRSVLRKRMGRANPFDCSYLQVIIFENKLEQSYTLMHFTINLKLQILSMMKQKQIIVTELISKIENMQKLIKQLKTNLNNLILLNDDSLDLLNLQAMYLENLCFSEKDINLVQVNKYRRKNLIQSSKYFNLQKEDDNISDIINNDNFDESTCIVFASYKDSKTLLINQISSNFSNLFGFTSQSNVLGRSIESIIPLPFQSVHQLYIRHYLEEEITNDNQIYGNYINQQQDIKMYSNKMEHQAQFETQNYSRLQENLSKNEAKQQILIQQSRSCKMNQQIIFASLNQMFIYPVRIDIRTNESKENEEFGLVAKIKQINKQNQYILFNATNLNVIGLSPQLYETFFADCDNLLKINLKSCFPFLSGTQDLIRIKSKDEQIQNIDCDITMQNHINLIDEMKDILKEEIENRQQTKNKLTFIVIQQSIMSKNTYFSSLNYNKKHVLMKQISELKNYNFTYVEINIQEIGYKGIENISYIEVTKMRELNPTNQATTILEEIRNKKKQNIYSLLFKNPNELSSIISLLEQQLLFVKNQFQINQQNSSLLVCKNNPAQNFQQSSNDQQNLKDQKHLQTFEEFQQNDYEEKNNLDFDSEANLNLEHIQKQQNEQSSKEKLNRDFDDMKNRVEFPSKDASQLKLLNQQSQINNNSVLSPCLTDKTTSNLEIISPNSTSYINLLHNQQINSSLSKQDINFQQKKQFQQIIQNLIDPNLNSDKCQKSQQKLKLNKSFKTIQKQLSTFEQNNINSKKNSQLDKMYQQTKNFNLKNKNHFKKHIQEIQQDIASISSKNSSPASTKRQLFQIMNDRSILQVIKTINIIGFICFTVMICITWIEYYQMNKNLSNANEDYQVFDWPTTYSSYLSNILKYQNTIYLLNYAKQLQFENNQQKQLFWSQIKSNMNLTQVNLFKLLSQMERANTRIEIFSLLRETNMTYYIGQFYNTSILSSTPSITTQLVAVDYKTNIQFSAILGAQNIYRYVNNLGNGRPEYYLIKNQLAAISELQKVQNLILTKQENRQDQIQDQQAVLMIILITINAACIGIIIPLYFYIQKERDEIIYLFSTFQVHKLDFLIKKIQNSYFNQNAPSQYQSKCTQILRETMVSLQSLNNEKDTKKQSISTITALPRFNKKIFFVTFCIFLTIICYPVTNKMLTQDYLIKTTLDLQTMMKVYYLRSYLLQNIAMNFNILAMIINPQLKPMTPDMYYSYLKNLIQQQQEITDQIQWITNSQYEYKRYNQELYDHFFFPTFKSNMCDAFRNYPEYNTNSTKINIGICTSSKYQLLQHGLEIAYKSIFSLFTDLYNIENKIDQQGITPLLTSVGNCCNLTQLTISLKQNNNKIDFGEPLSLGDGLSSLKQIQTLKLDLQQNEINDSIFVNICNGISNCANIQNLTLNLNQNKISFAEKYELGFQKCLNLTVFQLELNKNKIDQHGASYLANQLANISNLKNFQIDLGCNQIGSLGAANLGTGLANLKTLEVLNLSLETSHLCDKRVSELCKELKNSQNLNSLSLQFENNKIGNQGAHEIGNSLGSIKSLKTLTIDLKRNKVSQQGGFDLCNGLSNCQNLYALSLEFYYNTLNEEVVSGLCSRLGNCLYITSLYIGLSDNQIHAKGSQRLFVGLENCMNLQILTIDLVTNKIGSKGLTSLGNSLKNCQNLKNLTLKLRSNSISEIGGQDLGLNLGKCKRLSFLSINSVMNKIGCQGVSGLTKRLHQIGHLKNLILYLNNNKIGSQGILELGVGLRKIVSLVTLSIDLNQNEIDIIMAKKLITKLSKIMRLVNLEIQIL